ncbi:hypothetical protein EYC84_011369 [Monilinia fructicola]|uniref:Uncharacterized protein n=1 Tax=Monilinia fructicola TaxID=38448 RepID=A0A5M9J9B1_MONFR|nr:hypothetical protein EYC84_011369 [Monilinia fructicola]
MSSTRDLLWSKFRFSNLPDPYKRKSDSTTHIFRRFQVNDTLSKDVELVLFTSVTTTRLTFLSVPLMLFMTILTNRPIRCSYIILSKQTTVFQVASTSFESLSRNTQYTSRITITVTVTVTVTVTITLGNSRSSRHQNPGLLYKYSVISN